MEVKANDVINWLKGRRYDDDMIRGDERRIRNNQMVDAAIRYASEYLEKPDRGIIEDPSCPGGVCGSGGRV